MFAAQKPNCSHKGSSTASRTLKCSFKQLQLRHATCMAQHRKCCPSTAAASSPEHQQQTHPSISNSRTTSVAQHLSSSNSNNSTSWWSRLDWELLLLVSALPVPSALAEEGLKYDSSRGEGIVKTLSGALYIGLLLYFLFKVLNRRARKAREEVCANLIKYLQLGAPTCNMLLALSSW